MLFAFLVSLLASRSACLRILKVLQPTTQRTLAVNLAELSTHCDSAEVDRLDDSRQQSAL